MHERNDTLSTQRVRVRDVELAFRSHGQGTAFIWGHGLLTSIAQEIEVGVFDWSRSSSTEPERSLNINWIRYDARGHGESEATYDPADYRWPSLARDLLELASVLGHQRAYFGGVSMGCATSLHAAIAAPERVKGLILVAPPTAWNTRPRQAFAYRIGAGVVDWLGLGPFRLLSRIPAVGGEDSVVARMQRALVNHLAKADARAVTAALRGAALSDLPDPSELAKLNVPTLILAWPRDPVHPVSSARKVGEAIPNAELHIAGSLDEIRAWPERVRAFIEQTQLGDG